MKIYLDDDLESAGRKTPEGWVRVLNVHEFYNSVEKAIASNEEIEEISFDNDLGEPGLENEGRGAFKWLMNNHPELLKKGLHIRIHTDNNEARDSMMKDYEFWEKHVDELIKAKDRPDPWAESVKMK
jgi:hypothetical protein